MNEFKHVPVLFNETINALNIRPDGIYVDATAGGGGHSAAVCDRLTTGRLIAIDQDPDAIRTLKERFDGNKKVTVVHSNFVNIKPILNDLGIIGVNGVMADLGVSSYQLDTDERGFSFKKDAPLDMRMSQSGMTAAELVNTADYDKLKRIISEYGEERYAPSIARNIVSARQIKPIETTFELVDVIKASMPAKAMRDGHPARRTFQALRLEINQELEVLDKALDDMFDSLVVGGRLAVITFHSLEDRIVKKRFSSFCEGCICPKEFPVCVCGRTPRGLLPFKSKAPEKKETDENYRAHSARLRAVEKIK